MDPTLLTIGYVSCFQLAAAPAVVRIVKRRSSADLSIWRELLLLCGVGLQLTVFLMLGVTDWRVLISPIMSGLSVAVLLGLVARYRNGNAG